MSLDFRALMKEFVTDVEAHKGQSSIYLTDRRLAFTKFLVAHPEFGPLEEAMLDQLEALLAVLCRTASCSPARLFLRGPAQIVRLLKSCPYLSENESQDSSKVRKVSNCYLKGSLLTTYTGSLSELWSVLFQWSWPSDTSRVCLPGVITAPAH